MGHCTHFDSNQIPDWLERTRDAGHDDACDRGAVGPQGKERPTMSFSPLSDVIAAVNQVQQLLAATDRSIAVGVANDTDFTLSLTQSDGRSNFSSGGYAPNQLPSPSIPPRTADVFGTTNTAPSTGVVGVVHYAAADADGNDAGVLIHLNFANPFIGSDHYEQSVDAIGNVLAFFSVNVIGSVGNNSQVRYIITANPAA
jgi:hypothetical protein